MYTIHTYLPSGKCEYSHREGEALELSSQDGTLNHAILSFPEFQKLLRFRHAQLEKKRQQTVATKFS